MYFSHFAADCNGMVLRRYSAQEKCHGHVMVRKIVDRCDTSIKFGGRSSQSRSGLSSQSLLESMMHESVHGLTRARACAMPIGSCPS
mmetsp:Transcript_23769/g.46216  ORF Transcript_23769/g.46216 Transcript_23769/m.46216 type:complete len:87 (+) Transcript_23769:1433-1693(+)